MNRTCVYKLLLPTLFLLCSTAAAEDNMRGYVLASSCMACHGPSGRSPGSIPVIYGKPAATIEQKLSDFRDGNVDSTVMGRLAKGYSDEEIKSISSYISGLSGTE